MPLFKTCDFLVDADRLGLHGEVYPWLPCLRKEDHDGPHLVCSSHGRYQTWEIDFTCDCCHPEDDEHCLAHGDVDAKKLAQLL
jgi:hypothetical protein